MHRARNNRVQYAILIGKDCKIRCRGQIKIRTTASVISFAPTLSAFAEIVSFVLNIEHSPSNQELHDRDSSDENVAESTVIHNIVSYQLQLEMQF
jgi:hypothetical protein